MLNRHLQTEKLIQSSSAVAGELTKIVSKYRYNGSLVYGNTDWTKRFRPANIWAICDMKRCGLVWNYFDHSFTYWDRCKRAPECFAAVNVDAQSWHSPVESVECREHRVSRQYRRTFFRLTLRFFDDVVNYFLDSDFKFFDDAWYHKDSSFLMPKISANSTGVTPYGGAKCRWGGSKSATFDK